MPSERRSRRQAGLERAFVSLLGVTLLVAASVANAGILLGDTNVDAEVNQGDFQPLVAGVFGDDNGCPGLDVNGDGVISAADVVTLVEVLPPPAPTATPTPTPGIGTPSATPSITGSPRTPTATRSITRTRTATASITITPGGPTFTVTRTGTITRTPTNTRRATRT